MINVFVSYTTRDNLINVENLISLEDCLKTICQLYIDLIHNDSEDKQGRVESELLMSDLLLLLKTKETFESDWVQKEIKIAKENKIRILEFDYKKEKENNFKTMIREIEKIIEEKKHS